MFKGEKTLVFCVGLLVFGYSLAQFCTAIWQVIYYSVIYRHITDAPSVAWEWIVVAQVQVMTPLIISGVIFAVIGLYMMKKGVKQEQPSTQN